MSVISWKVRSMQFNSRWGNWEPPEYESALCCDECGANDTEDEEPDANFEAYEISWMDDYNVCSDCIDSYLSNTFIERFDETEKGANCPVCGEWFTDRDAFSEHVKTHLTFGGI